MAGFDPQSFTVDGTRLTPYIDGNSRFAALLALIDGARESLRLFYYIFTKDDAATRIRDALHAALGRGVSVTLVIDGFGSAVDQAFLAPLEEGGADVCMFHPRFGRRYLLRNHQKMALADEARAIIGGFNIADAYFDDDSPLHWRDLGLGVEGDPVRRLAGYFDVLARWSHQPRPPMRQLRRALRDWSEPDGAVRWLMGGPSLRLNPWVRAVKTDMGVARRLDLISAYFIPNPAMLRRIERIASRGIARLMTAQRTDSEITVAAARHSYHRLLRHGVEIWEYRAARLHTKLLILDDAVYIGSANFDIRSLYLNLELMLRIEDKAFAENMRNFCAQERIEAQYVTPRLHARRRTWFARLRWSIAYFIVGVLDASVTRRLNFGGWK